MTNQVIVLHTTPLVIVLRPTRRPMKNYRRGRLRLNLKPSPKAARLPSLVNILDLEST